MNGRTEAAARRTHNTGFPQVLPRPYPGRTHPREIPLHRCEFAVVYASFLPVGLERVGAVLAESVEAWGIEPVYTERYQEAALIQYYEGLDAYALPGVARMDQFDLWPTPWADRALFVRRWRSGDTMPSDAFCAERGEREAATERAEDGTPIERWQVAVVTGCGPKGGTP